MTLLKSIYVCKVDYEKEGHRCDTHPSYANKGKASREKVLFSLRKNELQCRRVMKINYKI